MQITTVLNLATQKEQIYTCDPRSACISAYAHEKKDGNTWEYERRYSGIVEETPYTFLVGDWCALKNTPSAPLVSR